MANSKRKSETDPVASGIKVITTKTCPSLSGKSQITYKLGLSEDNSLHIRLHENSGGGFFNVDWYPARALVDALRDVEEDESVTSRAIASLFRGRSANTPAFVTAALRNEGALLPYKRTSRRHIIGDLDAFLKQDNSSAPAKPKRKAQAKTTKTTKTTPRKTTKKTPAKKQ